MTDETPKDDTPPIIVYYSPDARPHERYLSFIELPDKSQLLIRHCGETEEQARERAREFWGYEKERQLRLMGKRAALAAPKPAQVTATASDTPRTSGFAGKIWVVNRGTQHKCRIDPGELPEYESRGYVRGGPRS